MSRIAIFAALQWECVPVLKSMPQAERGHLGGFTAWSSRRGQTEIVLIKTGIGFTQAAAAAAAVSDSAQWDLFVSTGCAGALDERLDRGHLTLATEMIDQALGTTVGTDEEERQRFVAAAGDAARLEGRVLSSPRALATIAEKRAAAIQFDAVAVEMEGAPLSACAQRLGVPFVSVRSILDRADTELEHSGQFVDTQTGAVKPFALARHLVAHPSAVRSLYGLKTMMDASQSTLRDVFQRWSAALR